jgi:DNA-binding transcriptional MerR regulator
MSNYSIKELEKLSGIKAHTLRIWEKRHGIIQPKRTPTNIRYYSDDDLKKILNISILNNQGIKISRLSSFTPNELNKKVIELSQSSKSHDIEIDRIILAMIELDEGKFEDLFSSLILKYGFEDTIQHIMYPFLIKIGVLWQTNNISPVQEHFISNLLRQKIIVAIDGLPRPDPDSKLFILFLPDGELHEIGLLFCDYMVRSKGFRSIYLGQSVPFNDLLAVCNEYQIDFLVTSITSPIEKDKLKFILSNISDISLNIKIFLSGPQITSSEIQSLPNMAHFSTSEEFLNIISEL